MNETKDNILHTALRLFARDGYEATSVSRIAGELGITKGALYKHYKNKRDIFDSIVERMFQLDVARANKYEVPEETFDRLPLAYRNTPMEKIIVFTEAQFQFWISDEFAHNFRKMLKLEQYRNEEIMELYQKVLVHGPISYMEDLFREMTETGIWPNTNPKQLALEFYAPFYLLLSFSDTTPGKEESPKLLKTHIERFLEKHNSL